MKRKRERENKNVILNTKLKENIRNNNTEKPRIKNLVKELKLN